MILKVFAIYDNKAEAYSRPFMFHATGEAIRAFTESANDPNHTFSKHPDDFALHELCIWDDGDGFHTQEKPPTPLGYARDFKKAATPKLVEETG